jgi:hypothetical protein
VSTGQEATIDSQGRSVTTLAPHSNVSPSVPSPVVAIPEGTVTIYSNLALSYSYDSGTGWTESGPFSSVGSSTLQAMAFKPTKGTYLLTQLDLAISYLSGTNGYTLELRNDNHGKPGQKIASWVVTGLPTFGATSMGLETIKVKGLIMLLKGSQYWLVPKVNSDEWAAWNYDSLNPVATGKLATSNDGGSTWTIYNNVVNGAYDVLGQKLF